MQRAWTRVSFLALRLLPFPALVVLQSSGLRSSKDRSVVGGIGVVSMPNWGRVLDESGCGSGLYTTYMFDGRTPLSQRATASEHGARTPATPPTSNRECTGSPIRERHNSVTDLARLSSTTPKRKEGKRTAVDSGARARGSGGGSGKKRIRSFPRASLISRLQPQVEERLDLAEYDAQQKQARTEAMLRRERGNAEADAEA